MIAFSLFWVTTRGFESSFPTPLASAAVIKRSTAKFGDRCPRKSPLVAALAPKFTLEGIPLLPPVPVNGGGIGEVVTGLEPIAGTPAAMLRPPVVVPAKAS